MTRQKTTDTPLTFWEHLDVLRSSLLKMLAAAIVTSVVAFFLKDELFALILAPSRSDFVTYRWMGAEAFSLHLINTELTEQFMIHVRVSLMVGVLVASPFIIFILYRFISPALYANERRYSLRLTLAAYAMFLLGIVVNYLLVFPLTVRFLGTYQVSQGVENMLAISSYIDTLLMMSIVFGVIFEIPVVAWLLATFGLIRYEWMTRYRRHAIVIILTLAAIVTPTADIITLLLVSLPIWLLYEASIQIVKLKNRATPD